MKEKFSDYIVQCFTMSGFNDIDAIMEMNVDEGAGNSISTIEEFIDHHSFPSCMNPYLHNHPFEFPPGHRIRIRHFVKETKEK